MVRKILFFLCATLIFAAVPLVILAVPVGYCWTCVVNQGELTICQSAISQLEFDITILGDQEAQLTREIDDLSRQAENLYQTMQNWFNIPLEDRDQYWNNVVKSMQADLAGLIRQKNAKYEERNWVWTQLATKQSIL